MKVSTMFLRIRTILKVKNGVLVFQYPKPWIKFIFSIWVLYVLTRTFINVFHLSSNYICKFKELSASCMSTSERLNLITSYRVLWAYQLSNNGTLLDLARSDIDRWKRKGWIRSNNWCDPIQNIYENIYFILSA